MTQSKSVVHRTCRRQRGEGQVAGGGRYRGVGNADENVAAADVVRLCENAVLRGALLEADERGSLPHVRSLVALYLCECYFL